MYGTLAAICVLAAVSGALFLLPVAFIFMWLESRQEKHERERRYALAHLPTVPSRCENCGGTKFYPSRRQWIIPAMGIRSMQMPMSGIARIGVFTCASCDTYGKYAIALDYPQHGWQLLTPYNLGF